MGDIRSILTSERNSKLKNFNMKTIFKLFVTIVVFVATSAVNEGDESLMKILAKERKEMREIFQRENERLAQQAEENAKQYQLQQQKLQRQNDQLLTNLEKQDAKLQQQVSKQAEEIAKQKEENAKQNQVQQHQQQINAKLHDQNRKLHQKLRRAEMETKNAFRQKDFKDKLDMKKMIHSEMQQSYIQAGSNNTNDTLVLELKKLIKKEINNFVMTERVCIGDTFGVGQSERTVDFGYTFPRIPTVVASSAYCRKGDSCGALVRKVTKSSAVIQTYVSEQDMYASWGMACL